MVKSHDIRDSYVLLQKRGKASEIATLLANKVHRSITNRWLHRYKQSDSICVKPKSGKPRTDRRKNGIYLVKKD